MINEAGNIKKLLSEYNVPWKKFPPSFSVKLIVYYTEIG